MTRALPTVAVSDHGGGVAALRMVREALAGRAAMINRNRLTDGPMPERCVVLRALGASGASTHPLGDPYTPQ